MRQGRWRPFVDWCNNSFLCICNARLYYAILQTQAKSSGVIRFLIPLTLIASQKMYTYSMCLVLKMQGKGKAMKCFLHSRFFFKNGKARKTVQRQPVI